jgi:hypothetical protein
MNVYIVKMIRELEWTFPNGVNSSPERSPASANPERLAASRGKGGVGDPGGRSTTPQGTRRSPPIHDSIIPILARSRQALNANLETNASALRLSEWHSADRLVPFFPMGVTSKRVRFLVQKAHSATIAQIEIRSTMFRVTLRRRRS